MIILFRLSKIIVVIESYREGYIWRLAALRSLSGRFRYLVSRVTNHKDSLHRGGLGWLRSMWFQR